MSGSFDAHFERSLESHPAGWLRSRVAYDCYIFNRRSLNYLTDVVHE